MLSHAPRQVTVSLTLGVRQNIEPMKITFKTWLVGFTILAPAALLPATRWFISEIDILWFADHRPLWWSLICIVIYLAACFLIPLWAVVNAKQFLRELAEPKSEPDYYTDAISELEKEKGA